MHGMPHSRTLSRSKIERRWRATYSLMRSFSTQMPKHFLDERAELLFANNAALLTRLLLRFEHVATVPGINPSALDASSLTKLYLEARLRTPILGRWPAIAGFSQNTASE